MQTRPMAPRTLARRIGRERTDRRTRGPSHGRPADGAPAGLGGPDGRSVASRRLHGAGRPPPRRRCAARTFPCARRDRPRRRARRDRPPPRPQRRRQDDGLARLRGPRAGGARRGAGARPRPARDAAPGPAPGRAAGPRHRPVRRPDGGRQRHVLGPRLPGRRRRHRRRPRPGRAATAGCATCPVARLSAGQRRRTSLACLLARRPELWLLDEPHAGLDQRRPRPARRPGPPGGRARARPCCMSSHELDRAEALADRVVELDGGQASGRGRRAAAERAPAARR